MRKYIKTNKYGWLKIKKSKNNSCNNCHLYLNSTLSYSCDMDEKTPDCYFNEYTFVKNVFCKILDKIN